MQGREFLQLARELVAGTEEYHWRGAVIHAYYALFLECREALGRWGTAIARHHNVHQAVRLKFAYARDPNLKDIGDQLEWLLRRRNPASYDLGVLAAFGSNRAALSGVTRATRALTLLDAIDADPALRAAAIASLPP